MVCVKSLLAAGAALANVSLTHAWIYAISAPETAAVGSIFTVTITNGLHIQNYQNFGIIWGFQRPPYQDRVTGEFELGWTNLVGPGATPMPPSGNFTVELTIPDGWPTGDVQLMAVTPIRVGALGSTDLVYLSQNMTLTAAT